jgi:uncharacterized protein (TIGR00725 family)
VKTIAVIGRAQRNEADAVAPETLRIAEAVGGLIAEAGAVLITGGTSGVMEAASKGAKGAGGLVVGVLPGRDRRSANVYVDIPMPTGLGTARNIIDARAADAVIMIGGAAGTLNELTIAYAEGKPIVVIRGTGGWAERIEAVLYDGRYLDDRHVVPIDFADTPREAVVIALQRIDAHFSRTPPLEEPL